MLSSVHHYNAFTCLSLWHNRFFTNSFFYKSYTSLYAITKVRVLKNTFTHNNRVWFLISWINHCTTHRSTKHYNELKDDINFLTNPVCPSRAAWWRAPLPLLSFWFILAPFCRRNSQAGNDPWRNNKTKRHPCRRLSKVGDRITTLSGWVIHFINFNFVIKGQERLESRVSWSGL